MAETLNLQELAGYRTGGTLHIIANNQVGFTTDPDEGRSTRYSSDLAKGFDTPIVHVNADDPEAAVSAIRLAMAFRARFRHDVVVDLVGYRRFGHNEGDEPSYTQPLMYKLIEEHRTVRELYARRLARGRPRHPGRGRGPHERGAGAHAGRARGAQGVVRNGCPAQGAPHRPRCRHAARDGRAGRAARAS